MEEDCVPCLHLQVLPWHGGVIVLDSVVHLVDSSLETVSYLTSHKAAMDLPPIWGTHEGGGDQCVCLAAQPGSHFHDEHAPWPSRSIQSDQQAEMESSAGLKCKRN